MRVLRALLALGLTIAAAVPTAAWAQGPTPNDCQTDFGCFVRAGVGCAPTRVARYMAVENAGLVLTSLVVFELRGLQGDRCVFYQRTEQPNLRLSDAARDAMQAGGWTPEQIQESEAVLNEGYVQMASGLDGTCRLPPADLASLLQRLNAGDYVPFDQYRAYCEGPMFTQQAGG